MTKPIRLQLSRRKGFSLHSHSIAKNGRCAVNVARPSKWGNPWRIRSVACSCRSVGECTHNQFFCDDAASAVEAFRHWSGGWKNPKALLGQLHKLRGKNLACWCALDQPCHADVLLELANAEEAVAA